jgi:hypothetical protein
VNRSETLGAQGFQRIPQRLKRSCWPDRHPSIFAPVSTEPQQDRTMYWTLELASYLEDAPWPATKEELIDFAMRTGAPLEVVENLQAIEDDEEVFESIEDIWPDYPSKEDFFFNEDEY